MKTEATTRGQKGFNRTELLVVIGAVALLVVVAAALLPALAAARRKSSRINCINNLKEVYLAAKIWSGDNGEKFPMQISVTNGGAMELAVTGDAAGIFRVMSNELSSPKILFCTSDAKRHYATNFAAGFSEANISYFLNLDASLNEPQMIFAGDDNLAVNGKPVRPGILSISTNNAIEWTKDRTDQYHGPGNIVLADGSAQQTTTRGLQQAVQQSSFITNRWVIP